MSAHTPGPWRYFKEGNGTRFHITARVVGTPGNDRDDFAQVDISHEANARLIAAAPELLEALRAIDAVETDDHYNDNEALWRCLNVARAALAKVRP